jgi:uncharacterized membrane protein
MEGGKATTDIKLCGGRFGGLPFGSPQSPSASRLLLPVDQGGGKRRSGNSATGTSVALTVVKPGGFMNPLLIIGLLVMFTLPL